MRIDVARVVAFVVDLDGVVTDTAAIHAAAWKRLFDEVLARHAGTSPPFDVTRDYRAHVDGKPRRDGLRSFLDARGISVPEGTPRDGEELETLYGLAARKNRYFLERLRATGVRAYADAVSLLREARMFGVRVAMATASENGAAVVAAARIGGLFDERFDGLDVARLGLAGKPAPDMFLAAARRLRVEPDRAALFEDSIAGVQAGRAASFAIVIGVDRVGQGDALRDAGADDVVSTLDDIELHDCARAEAR